MRLRLPFRRRPNAARRTGRRGERVAVRALRSRGYRILGRNLKTPEGEVDVLALDGDTLVVVEVKTRTGAVVVPRVRARQRRRLERAAAWLARRTRPRPPRVRLDLVAVTLGDGRPRARILEGGL